MNIQKATWQNGDRKMNLAFPFAKVDKENRTVSGFATLDNVDRHGDIVTSEASKSAFERFRGNIREMHQPIAVGKILSFNEEEYYDAKSGKNYRGVFVQAYISKGAQDTWEKVLDGTLTGFSIGGNIVKASMEPGESEEDEERRVIKEYDLHELSLVDNPANPLANVFSIQKNGDELIFKGMITEIETENVFWCGTDQVAASHSAEEKSCSICGDSMETIGWVEKVDDEKDHSIKKVVDSFLRKDDAPGPSHGPNGTLDSPSAPLNVIDSEETINLYPDQNNISTTKAGVGVGSMVTWKASGGKAYGKIVSIKTKGSIKVPDSSFEINAEEGDPAALIRIYEKTPEGLKQTDKLVGHKVSTLKPAKGTKAKTKISKGGNIVTEENLEDLEAEEINEVVEESDDVAVEEATEISEVEVDDLDFTKMVTDLKDFVGEKLEKSIEDTKANTTELRKALDDEKSDLLKRFDEVVAEKQELAKSIDSLTNLVTDLQKSLDETNSRIAMYENDTAFKKSGEVDNPAKIEKSNESIWQGRFLGAESL